VAGTVYWTPHQAAIIADRDGYNTEKWKNVLPGESRALNIARGTTTDSFATRWDTEDADGKLTITLWYPKFSVRTFLNI